MGNTNHGNVKHINTGAAWVFFDNRPLGYTNGGVTIKTSAEKTELEVDQVSDPVKTLNSKRTIEITVPVAEITKENLMLVFSGAQLKGTYPNEYISVNAGGGQKSGTLRLHPVDKEDDDFSGDYFFGNVSPSEDGEIPINKGEIQTASVTFSASPDEEGEILRYVGIPDSAKVPLGSLALNTQNITIKSGEEATVRILYTPENAFSREVTVTSEDDAVVLVQNAKNGYIELLGISSGTTEVIVTSKEGNKSTILSVVVS